MNELDSMTEAVGEARDRQANAMSQDDKEAVQLLEFVARDLNALAKIGFKLVKSGGIQEPDITWFNKFAKMVTNGLKQLKDTDLFGDMIRDVK